MILDRTWNKRDQKLTISYIDKLGNRKFFTKHLHHIKSYEYDNDGEFETWNGRKCKKIFKETTNYTPNEFELLEFMYELPKDLITLLKILRDEKIKKSSNLPKSLNQSGVFKLDANIKAQNEDTSKLIKILKLATDLKQM